LSHLTFPDFLELVVRQNVRPERPDNEDAPHLSDAVWEHAERCWVKNPKERPTAISLCETIADILPHQPLRPTVTHTRLGHSSQSPLLAPVIADRTSLYQSPRSLAPTLVITTSTSPSHWPQCPPSTPVDRTSPSQSLQSPLPPPV